MEDEDEALEKRVRLRMVYERSKSAFLAKDAAAITLFKRVRAAMSGMTTVVDRYDRGGDLLRISFFPLQPQDWLANLPTAQDIRLELTEWAGLNAEMRTAYGALDPLDKSEVKMPEGGTFAR